ncbi:methyltransferase domain-containing protein [Streptomyces sp. NBC_01016]|uniref:class I SAM-dependent methyltransferase n=1 Tax=Streptomyces sp. NBC_01016 TaxID=2903720 RepID=UPI00225BB7ED|nr:class I SAM-dependent methyltransferase [Streptomyces sp. NBC_01016]MCX4830736.1 methyltransferase domain-containing protein [Streptomyces sp. NBC_01016]
MDNDIAQYDTPQSNTDRYDTHQPDIPQSDIPQSDTAQEWDERYRSRDQLFSGNPNGVLVDEAADLPPGQALDVGCGEGGDALWLARRGWQVTAVDVSEVALRRAAAAGADVAGRVSWAQADLAVTPPPAGAFDLVTLQYFPLLRSAGLPALRGLVDAVAPGGTLLFTTHALADLTEHTEATAEFDPADYYWADDIAVLLDAEGDRTWKIQVNETRPRTAPAPPGTHHHRDTVLRARRTA